MPLCVCLMQIIGINHNRDYWDWNAPRRTPWFFCLYGITVVVDSLQRSPVSPLIASRANIEKWYRALVCATRRVTQFFVVWPVTGLKKRSSFLWDTFIDLNITTCRDVPYYILNSWKSVNIYCTIILLSSERQKEGKAIRSISIS